VRHRAPEGRQSAGAFALDERFEGFPKQGCLFDDAGEFLGGANEIVIQRNGGSHKISMHGL